jgi:two-component system chemotaxis response regulator CheB
VFRALELGALDFVAKPDAGDAAAWRHFEEALLRIAHAVALRVSSPIPRAHPLPQPRAELPATARRGTSTAPRAIATGSSTGGPGALVALLTALGPLPASSILIAQHMPEGFTRGFADRLARVTGLRVAEARDAEQIEPGGVWLAPGGAHLEVERSAHQLLTRISKSSAGERNAPSVDRLFESAAKHWGAELTAVVLTGMGYDGSRGVRAVRAAGGRVIAESEETAVIYGMPKRAIETGCVDRVVPLREIASELAQTRG